MARTPARAGKVEGQIGDPAPSAWLSGPRGGVSPGRKRTTTAPTTQGPVGHEQGGRPPHRRPPSVRSLSVSLCTGGAAGSAGAGRSGAILTNVQAVAGPTADRQGTRLVGLYVNPAGARGRVLCRRKPQIQALEHTAPLLPMQLAKSSGAASTTAATARLRCSRPSTSRPARSSANCTAAIGRVPEIAPRSIPSSATRCGAVLGAEHRRDRAPRAAPRGRISRPRPPATAERDSVQGRSSRPSRSILRAPARMP